MFVLTNIDGREYGIHPRDVVAVESVQNRGNPNFPGAQILTAFRVWSPGWPSADLHFTVIPMDPTLWRMFERFGVEMVALTLEKDDVLWVQKKLITSVVPVTGEEGCYLQFTVAEQPLTVQVFQNASLVLARIGAFNPLKQSNQVTNHSIMDSETLPPTTLPEPPTMFDPMARSAPHPGVVPTQLKPSEPQPHVPYTPFSPNIDPAQ